MSDPLRIALVAEGPTDRIVIEAAVSCLLRPRSFILKQLHPEASAAFGPLGPGWAGVYRWCRQAVQRATGSLRQDPLFASYDVLVLHLDADVADENYRNAGINEPIQNLPCSQPCPPPSATTNALRRVLLGWVGEVSVPPQTVLCTPSKNTEAWVVVALYPDDKAAKAGQWECHRDPESRLGQQPVRQRIKKSIRDYEACRGRLDAAWPSVRESLSEARRFSEEFLAALAMVVPPQT